MEEPTVHEHETGWFPFPNRPTDESVYRYPHEYRIQYRIIEGIRQQRHVWRWDGAGGKVEIEKWISTVVTASEIRATPRKEATSP